MAAAPKPAPHLPAFRAKGPNVKWPKLPGNPKVGGGLYPKAMEQGRLMEQSLGDAMHWLMNIKQQLQEMIINYIKQQLGLITCQLPDAIRPGALIAKIMDVVAKIQALIADIAAVVAAIQQCIGLLISMINNLKSMIQGIMNALAALLAELCNWNLPDLPSLPNLLGPFMNFPGFNLPSLSNIDLKFAWNFSMKDCRVHLPNLDIFRNQPMGFMITALDGTPFFHTPQPLVIPYSGEMVTLGNLEDPRYREQLKHRKDPVFSPDYVASDRVGSLPDPNKILSNYSLEPDDYKNHVMSLVLSDLIPQPGDADYGDLDSGLDGSGRPAGKGTSFERFSRIQNALKMYVNLGILADTLDPNRASLWLFWAEVNRIARSGTWTPENEKTYLELVKPSLEWLAENPVPFNNLLGEGPTVSAPVDLPFMEILKNEDHLWRLSFVEAGLMAVERNGRWDDKATDDRLSDWFRSIRSGVQAEEKVSCPVGIVRFKHDKGWHNVLSAMITKATRDIEYHSEWRTPRPQYRYIYDEFANAKETDRFSQFWKEVEDNYTTLLKEDPLLLDFVFFHYRILDSAVNPLGDPTLFSALKEDWLSRDRSWFMGRWIPEIPQGSPSSDTNYKPTLEESGWSGVPDKPVFNDLAFLQREDVRALPLNHQLTMLQMNQNYASFMKASTETIMEMENTLRNAQEEIANLQSMGFAVKSHLNRPVRNTPSHAIFEEASGSPQESTTVFKIPTAGTWSIAYDLKFSPTINAECVRTATTLINGSPVFSDQSGSTKEAVELGLSNVHVFKEGDLVEVMLSQSSSSDSMELLAGSSLSFLMADLPMAQVKIGDLGSTATTGSGTTNGSMAVNGVTSFKAGMDIAPLSVVFVNEDRKAYIINPTVPSNDPPYYDGVAVTGGADGDSISIVTVYGTVITLPGSNFKPGGLVYVSAEGHLTQDYRTLLTTTHWIIVIGRAYDTTTLIYEPHIPTNVLMRFN